MSALESIAKNSDLRKRIFITLALLAVYRIGVHVPTPGVDGTAVLSFFQAQSRGIFGLFNTFTGGALSQFSVFALGIMPYISASIIFQLLTSAVPVLESLKKEGEQGRRKINQYTRYATVALAVVQGYGISNWLMNSTSPDGRPLVLAPTVAFLPFPIMTVITLTAGTCFIMWLGEQITERGIGNGSSLIIFTGIAAAIPTGAQRLFELVKSGEMKFIIVLLLLALMVAIIAAVIYMEVAQRRITVQYSQRAGGGGMQSMQTPTSHLPIKINFSGVIPPIFASSLLMFPATMAQFVHVPWLKALQESLNPSGTIFNIMFVALIVFFSFFYTEIVFNPTEVADNLKKYGGFIPGIRAGKSTSDYIQKVLERVNVLGCVYLSTICILPGILASQLNVPFYFGGTSLLILVGVALDTAQQIQSHMITQKYEGFMKGAKLRSRRVQF
ncbi:preprotein translocase subunit SecY [Bdellovibrio sp. NC01]|uniref:preprotein translocase subunit SecY n=1 Tax=Bdellovibrio sp. NC01 TaxID=2220073 RepID=UPI0011591DD9|nr:preprotein translocase subunit SecY [Bdellovibrio sp. NC01]QDK38797.1 preprotein translocase subunit SecY [Bdellovibrio sp. NC01]